MKKIIIPLFFLFVTAVNGQEAEQIRKGLDSIAGELNIASVGFAVATSDSVIISDAVGVRDMDSGTPAGSTTVYRIGSATKTFIALGIMNLVQDGIISLDDHLSDLVPDIRIRNRWEKTNPVLLKHLLEHTAGFRDLYLSELSFPCDTEFMPLSDVIQRYPEYWKVRWQPGTRYAYSNPGYTLLGYIIEKYSGKPYNQYLEEIILDPLNMVNTDFLGRDHTKLAVSYDRNSNPMKASPILDHPAGYIHSTPEDMGKFIHFMLNKTETGQGKQLLNNELFHLMERPNSIVGAELGLAGYGLGVFATTAKGHTGFGHDGGIDEYLTSYVYFPDAEIAYYFTLTRMDIQAYEAVSGFLQDVLPENKEIITELYRQADLEGLGGWYKKKSYRLKLLKILTDMLEIARAEAKGDSLIITNIAGNREVLLPVGEGLFRNSDSELPTHFIGESGGKTVISSSYGETAGYFEKTSAFSALWKLLLFAASFAVFVTGGLTFTVNLIYRFFKRSSLNSAPLGWLAAGLVSFLFMMFSVGQLQSIYMISSVNLYSVAALVFSIMLTISLFTGFYSLTQGNTHKSHWKRVIVYVTYSGWTLTILFLIAYRLIPLVTWIW